MEVEGRVEFRSHAHLKQVRPCYDSTIFERAEVVQVSFMQRAGQGLCPNLLRGVFGNVSGYKQIENGYITGKDEFDSFPSSICRKFNYQSATHKKTKR